MHRHPWRRLAAISTDGSLSTTWVPDADGSVYAISNTGVGTSIVLSAGGSFYDINGESSPNFTTMAPQGMPSGVEQMKPLFF